MVLLTVLLRWGGSAGGRHGRPGGGCTAAGGLEVGDETVEQFGETACVVLVPSGERGERPVRTEGAGVVQRGGTGGRQPQQAGPAVERVGTALDVAGALEDGELTAGHRDVDAGAGGECTA